MAGEGVEPTRMTVLDILTALERYTGRFPKRAMHEAVEQREALTPDLLRVLEEAAANPQALAARDDYMLHVFAIFLLAQFREKRAYRPIFDIVSAPGEIPFDILGDIVTEGLGRILGSVYDGDAAPLKRLVEDEAVNEYVRHAAIDTFIVLAESGQMPRENVVGYFGELFHGRLLRAPSGAWNGLALAVVELPAPDLLEDLRQAYAEGLVERGFIDLEGVERYLRDPGGRRLGKYGIITDAIKELEPWACFREKPAPKKPVASPATPPPSRPVVPHVKVGRNDPCFCGSGKKFKKCCGNN
jgi:hypothetical protein